jgi:hypothetical protein
MQITERTFGGGQVAILQGLEHGGFRGWDAGKFKEVVRPVGKAVVWKPVVMVAGIRQGRGINASPVTDITVRESTIISGQETRIEFAGAQGAGDGIFFDGKAGQGQKAIESFGKTVGRKLDFVVRGLINLRGPTSGAVEPVADLLKG